MPQLFGKLVIIISLAGIFGSAGANDSTLENQRERFLDARNALNSKQLDEFHRLREQLTGYPLYPYLEYWYLLDRLSVTPKREILAFLERYDGQPVSSRLRRSWLYELAGKRDWKQFLAQYRGSRSAKLQCYHLQAQLHTGQKQRVVEEALPLWLVGRSQDKACDPVFSYLQKQGVLTRDLLWQRIRLAMSSGNPSLAGYLARSLPQQDRDWVSLWRKARQRPASTLKSEMLSSDTPIAREIILYALHRIARADVDQAHEKWADIRPKYQFDTDAAGELDKEIALLAGWRRHPDAHAWLAAVPDRVADNAVREWRARTAITADLWEDVLAHIDAMPEEEASNEEWRYWRAIALHKTGARQRARDQLSPLAKQRSYHGFLAADELRWPYVMDYRPIEASNEELAALRRQPAFVRARELYLANLLTEARREWAAAIANLDARGLKLAAQLAGELDWHDSAILTVARSADYDDLVLRFPIDHAEDIRRYADEYQLDPGHILAVIRTESAFNKNARSGAGALGLMQLMPATGRVTARKHRIPLPGSRHLYEPERNIQIGSAYLKQVMDQYDDNMVLASAAYNAGPHRVKRWLPDEQQQAENWIAAIPFGETRKYVQRILAYAAIYDWRMQRPILSLEKRMPDIQPQGHYEKTRAGAHARRTAS
jgi:soluble lytic murein transglycosylase